MGLRTRIKLFHRIFCSHPVVKEKLTFQIKTSKVIEKSSLRPFVMYMI